MFELTYACNHRCRFCSVPWDSPRNDYPRGPELDLATWRRVTDTLIGHGIRNVAFSGGEPLLKPGMAELLEDLLGRTVQEPVFDEQHRQTGMRERPLQITVISNGQLLDDEWVARLRQPQVTVVISLPGLETFHWHTGGDVRRALAAIEKLSAAGIPVVEGICVTRVNLPELLPTIAAGFLAGAKQLLLNRFLPGGRGLVYPDLMLDRRQIVEMLQVAEEACQAANSPGSIGTELPQCVVEGRFERLAIGTLCAGGVEFFAIDPAGRVRPCNHSPVQLGTWEDLPAAIGGDYWQRFKTKRFLPAMCHRCPISLRCDGGCREAAHLCGGSLDAPDPVFATTADPPEGLSIAK